MFLDPTLGTVVSLTRSVPVLDSPVAIKKFQVSSCVPVLSDGIWQSPLLCTSWKSASVCWKMQDALAAVCLLT